MRRYQQEPSRAPKQQQGTPKPTQATSSGYQMQQTSFQPIQTGYESSSSTTTGWKHSSTSMTSSAYIVASSRQPTGQQACWQPPRSENPNVSFGSGAAGSSSPMFGTPAATSTPVPPSGISGAGMTSPTALLGTYSPPIMMRTGPLSHGAAGAAAAALEKRWGQTSFGDEGDDSLSDMSTAEVIANQSQDYIDERLAEYQATILSLAGELY